MQTPHRIYKHWSLVGAESIEGACSSSNGNSKANSCIVLVQGALGGSGEGTIAYNKATLNVWWEGGFEKAA